jgi:hypothetical protein
VVGCDVTPSGQFRQVLEAHRIPRIGSRQIQRESEPFEVFPQVLQVGVAVVEGAISCELVLDEDSKRGANPSGGDLRRFGVKVAAEPLKVRAKEHDVPA